MKRIDFLRKLGLGVAAGSALAACKIESVSTDTTGTISNTNGTTNGSSASNCNVTKSETAGPFPTKDPNSLRIQDITSDRKGLTMTSNITIKNKNTNCSALQGAFVDIWMCDADGLYSEYGGSGMQSVNLQSVHFLRGRQTTDANGLVSFKSIFPGWYPGRATHIHVHIFNSAGKSLLVTQIAFPREVCDNVYKNVTSIYKNGTQDTSNERDNVFSDGFENELAGLNGNTKDGYTLTHTIVVSA